MSTLEETRSKMQMRIHQLICLNQEKDQEIERLTSLTDFLRLSASRVKEKEQECMKKKKQQDFNEKETRILSTDKILLQVKKYFRDKLTTNSNSSKNNSHHRQTYSKRDEVVFVGQSDKEEEEEDGQEEEKKDLSVTHLEHQLKRLDCILEKVRLDVISSSFHVEHLKQEEEVLGKELKLLQKTNHRLVRQMMTFQASRQPTASSGDIESNEMSEKRDSS